jgi:hypothetical protein
MLRQFDDETAAFTRFVAGPDVPGPPWTTAFSPMSCPAWRPEPTAGEAVAAKRGSTICRN